MKNKMVIYQTENQWFVYTKKLKKEKIVSSLFECHYQMSNIYQSFGFESKRTLKTR